MTELIRYDAACRAIADAKTVDEVKDIRDISAAMRAYARQSKNKTLEADAAEIRMRATRRLGQMMKAQKQAVGLNEGGRPVKTGVANTPVSQPTLAEAGIDKNLAKEARQLGALGDAEFEETVAETRYAVIHAATTVVTRRTKETRRELRMNELAGKASAWPKDVYSIVVADPAWQTQTWSAKGMDRAADNHYPTSSLDEIKMLPVSAITAEDSLLLLWTTVPHLEQAIEVIAAWGFAYKSMLTWDKEIVGTGYWLRNQTEHLIVATKGQFPLPPDHLKLSSLWRERRGTHSTKPEGILDWLDKAYPQLQKIELNRRGRARPGWAAWGNEAEADHSELDFAGGR